MAEVYLFGQVAAARKEQVKSVLAGFCAMKPVVFVERRVVFQPPKPPPVNISIGGSQSIAVVKSSDSAAQGTKDIFYAQLRKEIFWGDMGKDKSLDMKEAADGWMAVVHEQPDPQYKTTGSRKVSEIPLDGSYSTPFDFMKALGYTPVQEFLVHGHRFAQGNINIFSIQIYEIPFEKEPKIDLSVPHLKDLKPVDPANSICVHAYINIDDASNPRLIAQAATELQTLKEDFEGCINFHVPDRLILDPRFKG